MKKFVTPVPQKQNNIQYLLNKKIFNSSKKIKLTPFVEGDKSVGKQSKCNFEQLCNCIPVFI